MKQFIYTFSNIIIIYSVSFQLHCIYNIFHIYLFDVKDDMAKNLSYSFSEKTGKWNEQFSEAEFAAIQKLYHTYEFSDHIHFVALNDQYGSLFNYVKTGLLTEEEMIEALLH